MPSTWRGGRSREIDRRKEALHNLKANKSSDKSRSILSNRFGDDDSSEEEGGSRSGRDLAEKRRRRRELQRGGTGRRRSHGDDDDDYSDEDSDGRKPKAKVAAADLAAAKTTEDEEMAAAIRPEENVPVNWDQANHYLLKRRTFFEKHFFEPFFPQLVRGVYVRVPIEMVDGEMVYRFCEVVNVCKLARSYTFCGETTNTGIICAFGKSKREWKLNGVSGHSLREPSASGARSSRSPGHEELEKAVVLEERLQKLLAKNEERKKHNSDDVLRINEINRRNREANIQQDLHAQELNDAMNQKMTCAERL
ncbi:RNA polymerase-associated protein RTF1 [Phytophthora cinnamomi]|uniref:RNA polymerase-associated protein RTF1 n=1 Tax=Phytophthora cinnamomi TaxID=4785 RepID=UPI003559F2D6|nr:RNA polymerase-associated protein RTF1 [Phytophthora cinnamomi]